VRCLRDVHEPESGAFRADYALLAIGGVLILLFVLYLMGYTLDDLLFYVGRLEFLLFRR
jgi:hypothetical protein